MMDMKSELQIRGWKVRQSDKGNIVADLENYRAFIADDKAGIKVGKNWLYTTRSPRTILKFIDENGLNAN